MTGCRSLLPTPAHTGNKKQTFTGLLTTAFYSSGHHTLSTLRKHLSNGDKSSPRQHVIAGPLAVPAVDPLSCPLNINTTTHPSTHRCASRHSPNLLATHSYGSHQMSQ
ncbi:hypothetical protein E2C01_019116 [Portunus trituberculatus]|uniref:Uncharacterized protein n=1 Tax=Portunus trituberculatus TaxID=210409 RepID=A0A5B7DY03_PORTR|nr:hypothetical protein [Portunus trituberculatus]